MSKLSFVVTTRTATSLADLDTRWSIVGEKLRIVRSERRQWHYGVDEAPFRLAVAAGGLQIA